MNLSKYAAITVTYASTSVDSTGAAIQQTTGVTAVLSTAGSSGTGNQSSSYGGYPYAGGAVDMAGFTGALFIANITYWTTGIAGGNNTLQIYGANGGATTSLSTTFTKLNDAYAFGQSSTPFALIVDVQKPSHRFLQPQVQLATSSGVLTSINVIRYGARTEPTVALTTTAQFPTGANGAFGAVAANYLSVSPAT